MVFSSIIFLFLFLPVVLGLYYLIVLLMPKLGLDQRICRRLSNLFLFFASLVFYFWGENFLVWIIIASTSIDYICALVISGGLNRREIQKLTPDDSRTPVQRFGLVISIVSNLAFLFFFKYFNFGIDSYNQFMSGIGLNSAVLSDVIQITLPLGISFYTFQSMSYTIDVYRGHVRATRNFINFACYVTLFPQLVAGPIVRYRHIASQLSERIISSEKFAYGVSRFIQGLGKKVLIANTLAVLADKVLALPANDLTTILAWLGIVTYLLQLYYDFSGYSDMAIGLGYMFGFEFRENFNYPYYSRSIGEFWERWHISLSSWFRDYLYYPLGGNRHSTARTYFNLLLVFVLCGLWHGANWTFIVFGLYHGFFMILERLGVAKYLGAGRPIAGHFYAMLVHTCSLVIFTAESLSDAMAYFCVMAGFAEMGDPAHIMEEYLPLDILIAFIVGMIFAQPVRKILSRWRISIHNSLKRSGQVAFGYMFSGLRVAGLYLVLVLCFMSLAAGTHNPFIYFRF